MGPQPMPPHQQPAPPYPQPVVFHVPLPPRAAKPQSGAIAVLALVLTAMVVLWAVGTFVLLAYAPADFGVVPGTSPSPTE